tara:strand:- start:5771 stop:6583 length:813 start_codon:yes stop_codon:yes gene_type:complete
LRAAGKTHLDEDGYVHIDLGQRLLGAVLVKLHLLLVLGDDALYRLAVHADVLDEGARRGVVGRVREDDDGAEHAVGEALAERRYGAEGAQSEARVELCDGTLEQDKVAADVYRRRVSALVQILAARQVRGDHVAGTHLADRPCRGAVGAGTLGGEGHAAAPGRQTPDSPVMAFCSTFSGVSAAATTPSMLSAIVAALVALAGSGKEWGAWRRGEGAQWRSVVVVVVVVVAVRWVREELCPLTQAGRNIVTPMPRPARAIVYGPASTRPGL